MIKNSKHTEEAKMKMRETHIGKHFSPKTEIKKGQHLSRTTEFKKGIKSWQAGKTWKEDNRIPRPWLGKHHSEKTKKKISQNLKGINIGENNPNWKGGITSKDQKARSIFRRNIQKIVFERDNYTCQICGQIGGYLQVDHIQSWAEYIKQRFNIDNCRTLCQKCHYKITYGKTMSKEVRTWGHNFKQLERMVS